MARTSNETIILRLLVVIFATIAGGLGWYILRGHDLMAQANATLSPEQVDVLIGKYIKDHPDVVIGAIQDAQARAEKEKEEQAKANLVEMRGKIYENPSDPVLGNPKGSVSLVEFFDYRCPYCKRVSPDLESLMNEDSDLRVVLKEYPILGPESVYAAKVALAAQRQGRYAEMHAALMSHRGDFSEAALMDLAKSVGLDAERLTSDLADPAIAGQIQANLDLGHDLGVSGTPAFIIGRTMVPGAISLDDMKKLVKEARAEPQSN